ncbi:hypothetical protein VDG44_19085 [Xanthomonas campestris pv. raphani]|uniref:hypothetical protein n=1 Tax=Xanthomonas campestris TaxID=339 RepID=UPI002B236DA7|nr:hypothetical protein [Xanthomonas campestris]MEA9906613.1 hypothetical protein [Xanthomonas campestris pv. raphani]
MSDEKFEPYIPWVRDALLPGESTYAFLNKLGWFAVTGPLQLMRDLRINEQNQYPHKPGRIDYAEVVNEWSSKAHRYLWPIQQGRLGEYFNESDFLMLKDYSDGAWEEECLRFCTECVALGMHFTVCQLQFIEFCPYHQRRLISHCPVCGRQMKYAAAVPRPAFSCDSCGGSLLDADMTNVCANQRVRWRISHAYQELVGAMNACAPIYSMVTRRFGRRGTLSGVKEATTAMLESNRQRSEELSFVPRFAAIKAVPNHRGQPSIQRILKSHRAEEPCSIEKESRTVIHRTAQLRAGAWLLQRYSDHLTCIATSREVIKRKTFGQFPARTAHKLCCIGNGFVAWEMCHLDRVHERLPYELWDAWGLKSTAERSFGSYVLEKACLMSSISTFLRSDPDELSGWLASKLPTSFERWQASRTSEDIPAILWQDIKDVDFSEVCEALHLNDEARWQLVSAHCIESYDTLQEPVLAKIRAEHEAKNLKREYGARQRAAISMPILHARINEMNGCYH